ncbi:PREDICTED: large neutral amino acids transporter small subunit 4-like [Priapulus caudatus]|uniref:Large neutral amino acids transporter small subunit 4-like n=1 Tax=Priapulus caudatus TaxID=37621 RepID=A0ABM1EFH0_PRICU|nr:PREDICTED: large neutral amino acids transporter small subunit 4-like [Priapulus caudatus]
MAPTQFHAYSRRRWLMVTSVIENVLFSAVLLGWSSLVQILKREGFYSDLCMDQDHVEEGESVVLLESNATGAHNFTIGDNDIIGCPDQDKMLNLVFTVGSFLLSALTFPIGLIMDKIGSRKLRIIGGAMFCASCLLMTIASNKSSHLLFPIVSLNGVGGIILVFTSLQPVTARGKAKDYTSIGLKSTINNSLTYCGSLLAMLSCFLDVPEKGIPEPQDQKINKHTKTLQLQHKVTGKNFYSHVDKIGSRLSSPDVLHFQDEGKELYTSNADLVIKMNDLEEQENRNRKRQSLKAAVFSAIFLWSLVTLCITQLRLLFFIGALEQILMKVSGGDREQVELYTYFFGMMQLGCFIAAPLIGILMDWKTKEKFVERNIEANKEGNDTERSSFSSTRSTESCRSVKIDVKVRQLRNAMYAFFITNSITMIFGSIVLVPDLPLQVVAFLCHTIIRGFVHSAVGGLYAIAFHFKHYGSLVGLESLATALFSLLQYPLFILVEGQLKHDPFWVNVGLLVLSLLNYGLPLYLLKYCNGLDRANTHFAFVRSAALITSPSSQVVLLSSPTKPIDGSLTDAAALDRCEEWSSAQQPTFGLGCIYEEDKVFNEQEEEEGAARDMTGTDAIYRPTTIPVRENA